MAAMLKTCPKCGKSFKGAGLNGHLRFTHRLDETQVNALVAAAKPIGIAPSRDIQSDNPVYKLMDELLEIQRKRQELRANSSGVLLDRNPTIEKAIDLLDAMEGEISKRLDALKRQKGLPVGFFEQLDEFLGFRKKGASS